MLMFHVIVLTLYFCHYFMLLFLVPVFSYTEAGCACQVEEARRCSFRGCALVRDLPCCEVVLFYLLSLCSSFVSFVLAVVVLLFRWNKL